MCKRVLAIIMLTVLFAVPALASDHQPKKFGTLTIYTENDKFGGGTDQDYSNGLMISWVSPNINNWIDDDRLPAILTDYAEWTPFVNGKDRQRSVGISLGHAIFTPANVDTEELVPDDRPYCGWLFLSLGLHSKNKHVLDIFETTIGVVGPLALGEPVQNNYHNFINVKRAEGWKHELNNEPGLMFTWQRNWRWATQLGSSDWGADIIPHFGATLGNVKTHLNAGGEIRFGYNLPVNFGTALIGPARGISAGVDDPSNQGFGFHLYAGTDGRIVGRDITLDGNTFGGSHSVSKKTFVADLFAGIAFHYDEFSITYTQAMRTREFYGQKGDHVFGSLAISIAF